MVTEKKFLKVIELVLKEISDTSFNLNSKIISGKEEWIPQKVNTFENSFTERIARRLAELVPDAVEVE